MCKEIVRSQQWWNVTFKTVARIKSWRSSYGRLKKKIINNSKLIDKTWFEDKMNKLIANLESHAVNKMKQINSSIWFETCRKALGDVVSLRPEKRARRTSLPSQRVIFTVTPSATSVNREQRHNLSSQTLHVGATRASPSLNSDIYFVAKAHFSLSRVQGFKTIIFHLRLWHFWRYRARAHTTNQKCLSSNLLNARSQRQLENLKAASEQWVSAFISINSTWKCNNLLKTFLTQRVFQARTIFIFLW